VIGKWTVNTTLAKGHHALTQHTAKNFNFHMLAVRPFVQNNYFLPGEDGYSQDQFLAIQAGRQADRQTEEDRQTERLTNRSSQ
jgi:hypothetical protein